VIARDGARCRMAELAAGTLHRHLRIYRNLVTPSPDCTGGTVELLQAHHVLGRQATGDDPRFLVAACRACNLATGDPAATDPPHRTMTDWSSVPVD
jgi:hypothetical protein